jgi:hypothetical protein
MTAYLVRFKGMLTRKDREQLEAAGIKIENKERSMKIGVIKTGVPIFTVRIDAASEAEALAKVREALDPDTANFSNWESEPA